MLETWRWVLLVFGICILGWSPSSINAATDPNDVSALKALYSSLNSPSQLTQWSASGDDPCGQSWKGVKCSGSRVTEIDVSNHQLSGTLWSSLQSLTALTNLDMSHNNLQGSIPYSLPPNMTRLNISHNLLQNQVDDIFGKLSSLSTLDLSFNSLSGNLPESLSSLSSMTTMYLQNNQLTGTINVLANLPLENLNIQNNQFTGWIPEQLKNINLEKDGNQWNSGPAPPPPPGTPPASKNNGNHKSGSNGSPSKGGAGEGGKKSGIGGGGIAGIVISLLVVTGVVAFFIIKRRSRRSSSDVEKFDSQPFAPLASEVKEMMKNFKPNWLVECEGQHFAYSEIVKITNDFASIIGRGGFGTVYLGTLTNETQVAVKLLNSSSRQGSKEFKNEVELLMRTRHRNLVSLVGYCNEGETMALVYEYVANGNLQQHLSADVTQDVLTWKERLQIAVDTARGLDYLHNGCKLPIVHRDLKTSNILLNEKLQAKIADFGLSKVLSTESATHVSTAAKGTFGYLDPQYCNTGQLNKKSDVYSFGIVLQELITGRAAITRDEEDVPIHICQWMCPKFESMEIESIVDSRLQGSYLNSSARKAIEIAMACASSTAIQRPDITVVHNDLKECLEIEMPFEITEIVESDDASSSSSVTMASNIESQTDIAVLEQ